MCSFTVACNDRRKNEDTNTWEDILPTFFRCSAFGQMAENVAESLTQGALVIVQGKISERKYTDRDGQERTSYQEVRVEEIGPALRFNTVRVDDTDQREKQPAKAAAAPADDPFA